MRAGIYARISEDKAGAGLGVARQETDCRTDVTDPLGASVKVYADNDRSAYNGKPRPAYERLLADARAGELDMIVAWHPDRLHRSPRELEEFIDVVEERGIRVETVRAGTVDLSTPAGRMVARQLGAVARYESEHKADRIRRKMEELARNGDGRGGGTRPFGYQADRMTVRKDEAKVIRELAKRLLTGASLKSLCRGLEERGVRTPTGKAWTPEPLKRMLRSARISGQREHHGEIVAKAKWPAIIPPEQTTQIRAILDDPSRRNMRAPRTYLLKGLLRCGRCGSTLVARPREDGSRRYVCARGPGFHGCGKTYVLAEPLEEFVTEAVLWRLDSPDLARAIRGAQDEQASECQAKADAATVKLDELAGLYASDAISKREWMAAREPLQRQLEEARRRVSRSASTGAVSEHAGRAGELRKRWSGLDVESRHAVIGSVLSHVTVGAGRRGYNRFDPDRFGLVWRY